MRLSPEAKQQLIAEPALFILHFFPHRIQVLKEFHIELINLALDERRGLELYPATHGKTSLISEIIPIYEICKDPDIRIGGLFKNQQEARAITRSIQSELVTNMDLIENFGPFQPEPDDEGKIWTQDRFDVAKRQRKGKSSTWAAFGAKGRGALGYRTDHTIADDVVTDQNSSTPEQREGLREWFMQGPMTMPDRHDGRITVVGTAFHPDDMYHEMMRMKLNDNDDRLWTTKVRRAILNDRTQEVLWPEMRPYLFLMEQKVAMGTLDFNKRFQNEALDPSGLVFHEAYIYGGTLKGEKYPGCLDEGYTIEDSEPGWKVYTGFDPAVGTTRGHKFCAHVTLGVGSCPKHETCYWLIDLKRDQMTLPQQVQLIIDQHLKYNATKSLVEANVYQAGLVQQVKDKLMELNIGIQVEPHYTTRVNKPDPDQGVMSMGTVVEQGRLHIPWRDAASRTRMQQLVDELVQYTGVKSSKTTDTVMALWFAWRAAQVSAPRFKPINRLDNQRTWGWPGVKNGWGTPIRNPVYVGNDD